MDFSYTILIVLIPLISFIFLGLFGNKLQPKIASAFGTSALFISFILSVFTAYQYFFVFGKVAGVFQKIVAFNITWLQFSDKLQVSLGSLIDPISVMMLVVITTVSLMVHIYSIGYMKGEKGYQRFYAFLSLFTFSMLGLVLATNIFQMYIFWELVGVSSFLLIGFYYHKPSAVAASKKAFIVTRFADFFFLIGILVLSYNTGTLDFAKLTDPTTNIFAQSDAQYFLGFSVTSWAMILIFMGGAGKSAMMPFHIWLPDAMEGPTPVSALIHAATMVVAGVYLVARMFTVYAIHTPDVLQVVAWVGGLSSLFAAIIACTQIDIKRVLAYSTMSQIGYMMLALGVSGYGLEEAGLGYMASMFHLFTHAMFKALLFLGAGAIIHAVHSNNMTDMGQLRKYLPITHITFLIACLTIAGIPPFSGFFSKDEILVAAFEHNKILFAIEYLVAGLTAFYMFRLYYNVFWGQERTYHHTPHEAPVSMTLPLLILTIGSVLAGLIPFSSLVSCTGEGFQTHTQWAIALPSIAIALVGIGVATILYKKHSALPERIALSVKGLHKLVFNKFYFDELYLFITRKIIFRYFAKTAQWFELNIIDGMMNGMGSVITVSSNLIKGMQSGKMQQYALYFISTVVVLFAVIFWWVY